MEENPLSMYPDRSISYFSVQKDSTEICNGKKKATIRNLERLFIVALFLYIAACLNIKKIHSFNCLGIYFSSAIVNFRNFWIQIIVSIIIITDSRLSTAYWTTLQLYRVYEDISMEG